MQVRANALNVAAAAGFAAGGSLLGYAIARLPGSSAPVPLEFTSPIVEDRPDLAGKDTAVVHGAVVALDAAARTATLDNGFTYHVPDTLPLPPLHQEVAVRLALGRQ